jgi:hypothetical protein
MVELVMASDTRLKCTMRTKQAVIGGSGLIISTRPSKEPKDTIVLQTFKKQVFFEFLLLSTWLSLSLGVDMVRAGDNRRRRAG